MAALRLDSHQGNAEKVRVVDKEIEWISVSKAAEILGVSRTTIHAMIQRGDLPAERVPFGSRFIYRIDRADLDNVTLKPPHRPKTKG